jgi:hypothetical protein
MSGSGSGMQEVAGGDDVGEPAKKKQKTATSLNVCFLKDCEGPFACSARS